MLSYIYVGVSQHTYNLSHLCNLQVIVYYVLGKTF